MFNHKLRWGYKFWYFKISGSYGVYAMGTEKQAERWCRLKARCEGVAVTSHLCTEEEITASNINDWGILVILLKNLKVKRK